MNQDQQRQNRRNSFILKLRELSRGDTKRAGAKAANLGELMGAGFSVPDGFVVTTDAFEEFIAASTFSADVSPENVEAAPLPADLAEAVRVAAAAIGDVPLAVRSSAVAEDLPGASFAGQYETVLDVRGTDDLVAAVRHCWASAFSERVLAYRKAQGQQNAGGMAVLIQRLVQADAAGVAFTANPVTGERTEVVVSAVRGLGERLVSGQASPDEWLVRDGEAVCQRAPEGAIDADQVRAVAELARRVEQHFGVPQDIEWAFADNQLFLLQARPITALPQRPELQVPSEGYWTKDQAHFPSPITPFGVSVYLPALERGGNMMCQEFGLPIEGIQQRAIGGEVYARVVPPGGKDRPAPPSWVLFLATRLMPAMRRQRRVIEQAIQPGLLESLFERWHEEWREQFREQASDLRSRNLTELDDRALLEHLDRVIDLMHHGQVVHFRLLIPYVLAMHELAMVCAELLGWDDVKALSMVSGISETSSEPGRRLAELAAIASQSPPAREILAESGVDVISRLREAAPSIAEAFEAYIDEYGHRAIDYDPGSPTLAERLGLLAKLLHNRISASLLEAAQDPKQVRQEAMQRARTELTHRSTEDRERFERVLAAAECAYPVREDNVFYTDNIPNALARYTVLEIGRRLAARSAIARPEDAVYLEDAELRAAIGTTQSDLDSLITRRKAERAWVAANPGPLSYGKDPGPPPDPDVMPEPLRQVTKAQIWYMNLAIGQPKRTVAANEIVGVPGSPGRHTGTVRLVRGESEFPRLMPGDVLVCPITTPTWSILFAHAGAVVTDGGGVLSHAAVIARENGIPAVLGTGDGTRRLRDGQKVTVDGNTGLVQVLEDK